jgi:2-isopropylmalate synthase
VDVLDYAEHALSAGHEASAAAYVELTDGHRTVRWGVGIDKSISSASLKAVISAINHQRATSK